MLLCGIHWIVTGQHIQPAHVVSQAYTTYTNHGIDGLFSNQAGLHSMTGLSAEVSALQRYFSEGVLELHVGVAAPLGTYTGGGLYVRRFGDDVFSETSLGLAIGRKLFQAFSLGIALEAYQLSIENYGSDWQFNSQIGFQADVGKQVAIGSHLYLPLQSPENLSFSNQAVFNIDVAVQAEKHLKLKAGARKINDENLGLKFSVMYEPMNILEIHAGFLSYPSHYTFGAGITIFDDVQFFAAGLYQSDLGWSSGINLRYAPAN